jgi:c(7)-type cytochrome triheme protein
MHLHSANIKRVWPTLIVICAGAWLLLFAYSSRAVNSKAAFAEAVRAETDYSKFSHRSESHSRLACASCHMRADNSAAPRLPGHKACTDCHFAEFVNPKAPLCNICHSSLSEGDPPLRAFPGRFNESFNAKFDHAQHNQGEGRPAAGCAACHTATLRRGVAMTIPAGLGAHNTCYQCHTPGRTYAGRDISSCAACHTVAAYRRTQTNAVAFGASFSHAEHGARQRLTCTDCHSVRAGLAQAQQVGSPRTAQHFAPARTTSCATCHNNKRAFGEADYGDCRRCHTGATFKFRGVG